MRGQSIVCSSGCSHQRDCSNRAATPPHELQWRGDHDRASRWQSIQIAQAGESELAAAVHDVVIRKRRIERAGLSGIRADGLDANTEDIAIVGQYARRGLIETGAMWAVLADVEKRRT